MVATITCQPLAASPSQRPIWNGWMLSRPTGPDRPAPRHGAQQTGTWHLPDGLQRPSATRGLPGWRPVLGAQSPVPARVLRDVPGWCRRTFGAASARPRGRPRGPTPRSSACVPQSQRQLGRVNLSLRMGRASSVETGPRWWQSGHMATDERDRLSAFALRVWGYKQGEGVSLMIHLGDRLGLYRAMAGRGPMTAAGVRPPPGCRNAGCWNGFAARPPRA